MAGFIQIIEFRSSRADDIRKLAEDIDREGGTAVRLTATEDRDHPGHFFTIAEFDSYETAMENSNRPETSAFAAKMGELCDGPPTFYNLDVSESWSR